MIDVHMQNVERTGVMRTRFTQRLVPVVGTCDANLAEITSLCVRIVEPAFANDEGKAFKYKIELRVRNHNTLLRDDVIKAIAKCVPEVHKVDLSDPELFILVEIFKSVCGISVVKDYYRFKKYNVIELYQGKGPAAKGEPAALTDEIEMNE